MEIVLTIINLFFEFWLTAILSYSCLHKKLVLNKRIILILFSYLTFDFFIQFLPLPDYILYIVLQLSFIFVTWLLFRMHVYSCIMLFLLTYVSLVAIQYFLIGILMPFVPNVSSSATGVIGNSLTLICIIILCKLLPLHKIYNIVEEASLVVKSFLVTGYMVFLFINTMFQFETSDYLTNILLIGVAIIMIIFVNVNMFYINSKVIVQQKIISAHDEYLPIVDELIKEVRVKQHDFNNQIQSILSLPLVYNRFEDLSEAILRQTNALTRASNTSKLLSINYRLLSALIFSKTSIASEQKKNFTYTVLSPDLESKLPEYMLIEVVGILIDNAFEATNEEDDIHLIFNQFNDKMVITSKNVGPIVTPEFVRNMFTLGFSTKSSRGDRGIGMYKLKSIVDDNDGDLTIFNENIKGKTFICFEVKI